MRMMRMIVVGAVVVVLFYGASLVLAAWSAPRYVAVLHIQRNEASSGSYSVLGAPTISAAFINRVLAAYGSPAAGTGQALYALGVRDGIDPVYALAFFEHESSFGKTGWGAVNHSLGNSRCGGWSSCQGGYRFYPTWQAGYADWYRLILYGYVRGEVTVPLVGHACATVAQIVPVYAPSSDGNDVTAYVGAVEQAVQGWRSGKLWA